MNDKTKESLNQFLTEWMGGHYHQWDEGENAAECLTCGEQCYTRGMYNPDWTSRERFLDLWDKARKDDGWDEFVLQYFGSTINHEVAFVFTINLLIAQPTFAEEWAKFLGWKRKDYV